MRSRAGQGNLLSGQTRTTVWKPPLTATLGASYSFLPRFRVSVFSGPGVSKREASLLTAGAFLLPLELLAILDWVMTGKYAKRINLILFRPITENTLPITDPMTLGLKFREHNPAMNYQMKNPNNEFVIFGRNITRDYFARTLTGD